MGRGGSSGPLSGGSSGSSAGPLATPALPTSEGGSAGRALRAGTFAFAGRGFLGIWLTLRRLSWLERGDAWSWIRPGATSHRSETVST